MGCIMSLKVKCFQQQEIYTLRLFLMMHFIWSTFQKQTSGKNCVFSEIRNIFIGVRLFIAKCCLLKF